MQEESHVFIVSVSANTLSLSFSLAISLSHTHTHTPLSHFHVFRSPVLLLLQGALITGQPLMHAGGWKSSGHTLVLMMMLLLLLSSVWAPTLIPAHTHSCFTVCTHAVPGHPSALLTAHTHTHTNSPLTPPLDCLRPEMTHSCFQCLGSRPPIS